jgi:hypothetical protein
MTTNNHQGGATRRGGLGSKHEAQPRAAKPKSPQQRRKSPGRRRGGCNDARAPQAFKVKSAAAQITRRLREGVNLIVVRRPVGAAGRAIQRPFSWIVRTKARGHEKVAAADEDEKRTGSTTFQIVLYTKRDPPHALILATGEEKLIGESLITKVLSIYVRAICYAGLS